MTEEDLKLYARFITCDKIQIEFDNTYTYEKNKLKQIIERIKQYDLSQPLTQDAINDIGVGISIIQSYSKWFFDKDLPYIRYHTDLTLSRIRFYLEYGSYCRGNTVLPDNFDKNSTKIIDPRSLYVTNLHNVILLFKDDWDKYISCVRCGELVRIEDTHYINGKAIDLDAIDLGSVLCDKCYHNSIKECYKCGKQINIYCDLFTQVDNDYCCNDCYSKVRKLMIKRYHDNPILEYYDYDSDGNNKQVSGMDFKGYGIELEVGKMGQKHRNSEEVLKILKEEAYTMRDGSINPQCNFGDDFDYGGFEIVTHPHTEKALYNMEWKSAFRYLLHKGYRSHDIGTCGLHMHISRTLLTKKAIIRMMYFYDKWYKDVCRFARRSQDTATRWASYNFLSPTLQKEAERFYNADSRQVHNCRYVAVNIQNKDTVEIRIMRGTLKLSTFMATLDFLITIAKNSKKIKDEEVDDLSKWLSGMKPETYQYMAERRCFGFAQDQPINEETQLEDNVKVEEARPNVTQNTIDLGHIWDIWNTNQN